MRHPNYVAVMGEIAGVALMMRAPFTGVGSAIVFGAAAARPYPRRGTDAEGGAMSGVALTAVPVVEPLPATHPLAWWVRALDVISGVAVLLLISIVVFGGFRLRYGELRITAQDVWRPLAVLVLAAGVRHWRVPRPSWPERAAGRPARRVGGAGDARGAAGVDRLAADGARGGLSRRRAGRLPRQARPA
jgi:hypothetical protein